MLDRFNFAAPGPLVPGRLKQPKKGSGLEKRQQQVASHNHSHKNSLHKPAPAAPKVGATQAGPGAALSSQGPDRRGQSEGPSPRPAAQVAGRRPRALRLPGEEEKAGEGRPARSGQRPAQEKDQVHRESDAQKQLARPQRSEDRAFPFRADRGPQENPQEDLLGDPSEPLARPRLGLRLAGRPEAAAFAPQARPAAAEDTQAFPSDLQAVSQGRPATAARLLGLFPQVLPAARLPRRGQELAGQRLDPAAAAAGQRPARAAGQARERPGVSAARSRLRKEPPDHQRRPGSPC